MTYAPPPDSELIARARAYVENMGDIQVDDDARIVHADEHEAFHAVQAWIYVPNDKQHRSCDP